jgi:hypothetical protein
VLCELCGEKYIKSSLTGQIRAKMFPEIRLFEDVSRYHKKSVLSIMHRCVKIFGG